MRRWPLPTAGCSPGSAAPSSDLGVTPSGQPVPVAGVKAHVFVADLEAPELDPADQHHLMQVLRIRPGDVVTVSDGAGGWRACRMGRDGELTGCGDITRVDAAAPVLTVGIALTKSGRSEVAVQKLTELGVERIVPFLAERSVVRWEGARATRHVERLRRVAREAAMQSRRLYLPVIDSITGFTSVAALAGAVIAQVGGGPPSLRRPVVLVGPEGGWSPQELSLGLPRIGLGPQVLRAETAAMAVANLLAALRAGLVRSVEEPEA